MRNLLFIFIVSLMVFSCSDPVIRPKNLIEEDKMSQIIAEFAIADQIRNVKPMGDMNKESLYILKKHRIKSTDFVESYRFYISKPKKLESILDNAQDIIKEKTPAGDQYISKKLKEEEERKAKAEKEQKEREEKAKNESKKHKNDIIKKD